MNKKLKKNRKFKSNAGVVNVKSAKVSKFLTFIAQNPDRTIRAFDAKRAKEMQDGLN